MGSSSVPVESVTASSYRVPAASAEADGTLEWDATTMVVVEISGGGENGLGYSYTDRAAAALVDDVLAEELSGCDAMAIPAAWSAMLRRVRNFGHRGIAASAISACDVALHDLKAKLLDLPLIALLGSRHDALPVYGSGGFTSYADNELADQLAGWVEEGIGAVKMKVGTEPARDPARVARARDAVGDAGLFVDANGAYARKQALALAEAFADSGVSWFEEPVSSDDIEGLRLLRDRVPAGIEISAGEYGYDLFHFRQLAEAGAVDVLQADATRCLGFTGFMQADGIAFAFGLPLSSHTAPALHLHCCCAAKCLRHMEWFFDHVRIEEMFFDGAPRLRDGCLAPDLSRPGLGLEFRRSDAEPYRI